MTKKAKKGIIIPLSIVTSICISYIAFILIYAHYCSKNQQNNLFFSSSKIGKPETYSGEIRGVPKGIELVNYNRNELVNNINYGSNTNNYGLIFPDVLSDGSASCYKYFKQVKRIDIGRYDNRTEIYLEWHTNYELFEKEINRFEELRYPTSKDIIKKALFTNDLFAMKCVLLSYNHDSRFEYALFDEQSLTIHYVYLYDIGYFKNIVFDKKYAPTNLLKNSDLKGIDTCNKGYYSIYGF